MSETKQVEGMSNAPWSEDEVASLNEYQASGAMHPFTGKRKPNGDETILIATKNGWVESPEGPVVQTWAHPWMADWGWRDAQPPKAVGSPTNSIVLTGKLVPWLNEPSDGPVLIGILGTPHAYVPCFSSEELLRQTMERAAVPFDSIKKITDGREFETSVPRSNGKQEIRIVVDLRFTEENKFRYFEAVRN